MTVRCLVIMYTDRVRRTTRLTRHCPADYRDSVPYVRKTPQRTVGIDDELWADVHTIARARRERVSAIIRAALIDYRERNVHILLAERAAQTETSDEPGHAADA